jgi:hypothetical protein
MTANQTALPRLSAQKPSSRTYVIWAVVSLVVAVGASWPIYSAWHEVQQAKYRTAQVPGRLDPQYVRRSRSRGLSVHYDITYRFSVNGIEYAGKDTTDEAPTEIGTTIHYDPTNPPNSQTAQHSAQTMVSLLAETIVFGAIVIVALCGVYAFGEGWLRSGRPNKSVVI